MRVPMRNGSSRWLLAMLLGLSLAGAGVAAPGAARAQSSGREIRLPPEPGPPSAAVELAGRVRRALAVPERFQARLTIEVQDIGRRLTLRGTLAGEPPSRLRFDYTEPAELAGAVAWLNGPWSALLRKGEEKPQVRLGPPPFIFQVVPGVFLGWAREWQPEPGWAVRSTERQGRRVYVAEGPAGEGGAVRLRMVFDAATLLPVERRLIREGKDEAVLFAAVEGAPVGGRPGMFRAELRQKPGDAKPWEVSFRQVDGRWVPVEARIPLPEGEARYTLQEVALTTHLAQGALTHPELERVRQAYEAGEKALEAGDWAAAARHFRTVVLADPYNAPARTNLGFAYARRGELMAALSEFEQVVSLSPEDPLSYNNLAYLYIDSEIDLDRGLAMSQHAVKLAPGNPAFRDTLGWGYFRQGKLEEARDELEEALRQLEAGARVPPREQALFHYHLGEVYASLGRAEAAREQYRRALELDPELAEAREGLKRLEGQARQEPVAEAR